MPFSRFPSLTNQIECPHSPFLRHNYANFNLEMSTIILNTGPRKSNPGSNHRVFKLAGILDGLVLNIPKQFSEFIIPIIQF